MQINAVKYYLSKKLLSLKNNTLFAFYLPTLQLIKVIVHTNTCLDLVPWDFGNLPTGHLIAAKNHVHERAHHLLPIKEVPDLVEVFNRDMNSLTDVFLLKKKHA